MIGSKIVLIASTLAAQVIAHGQLTVPEPRPDNNGNTRGGNQEDPSWDLDGGRNGFSGTDFRCRGYDRDNSQQRATLRAGQDFTIRWEMDIPHPGDCFLYVSEPGQNIDNPANWFKILSIPGCGSSSGNTPSKTNSLTFTVPEGIPACSDCVLRWEWYRVGTIEMYNNCADIVVENDLGTGSITSGIVSISGIGHLPQNENSYRDVGERGGLVGPAEATFSLTPFVTTTTTAPQQTELQTEFVTTTETATSTSTITETVLETQTTTIVSTNTEIVTTTDIPVTTTTTTQVSTTTEEPIATTTTTQVPTTTDEPVVTTTTTQVPTMTEEPIATTTTTTTTISQPIYTETPTNTETPVYTETPDPNNYCCSFEAAGAELKEWSSGFWVKNALFSNCAGTTIEFDWVGGSNCAEIINYWGATLEVLNYGATVRFTTLHDYTPFGFQADGEFKIQNLKVNGNYCY